MSFHELLDGLLTELQVPFYEGQPESRRIMSRLTFTQPAHISTSTAPIRSTILQRFYSITDSSGRAVPSACRTIFPVIITELQNFTIS